MEWEGLTYDVPVSKVSLNDNVGPQRYVQPLLGRAKQSDQDDQEE